MYSHIHYSFCTVQRIPSAVDKTTGVSYRISDLVVQQPPNDSQTAPAADSEMGAAKPTVCEIFCLCLYDWTL